MPDFRTRVMAKIRRGRPGRTANEGRYTDVETITGTETGSSAGGSPGCASHDTKGYLAPCRLRRQPAAMEACDLSKGRRCSDQRQKRKARG